MEGLDIPAERPWMLGQLIGENDSEVRQGIAVIRAAIHAYPHIHAVAAHDASALSSLRLVSWRAAARVAHHRRHGKENFHGRRFLQPGPGMARMEDCVCRAELTTQPS
jgi:hypothetical protein